MKFKVSNKNFSYEEKNNFLEFQVEDFLSYFKGSKLSDLRQKNGIGEWR